MPITYNESVAGEVRAEMGRHNITASGLAILLGWNRQYLARRLHGAVPWSTNDLERISQALRIPLSALTSPRAKSA